MGERSSSRSGSAFMTKVVCLCAIAAFPIAWLGVMELPELQAWPYELLVAGYVVSTAIGGLVVWGVCSRSDDASCGYGLKKRGIS